MILDYPSIFFWLDVDLLSFRCCHLQKQPSRGVLMKRCSENMLQIYRRAPMPKFDIKKVSLQFFWNHTSAWVFSCKFAAYFPKIFFLEHLWMAASASNRQINILLYHRTIFIVSVVKFVCYSKISYFHFFIKKQLTVVLYDFLFSISKLSGSSHEELLH